MTNQVPSEVLAEFIAECEEILQRVSTNLNMIEEGTPTKDVIDELYRDMHTMKGSAHLFGFKNIGDVAHAMESSLETYRENQTDVGKELMDVLFKCLNLLDELMLGIQGDEESGNDIVKINHHIALLVDIKSGNNPGGNGIGKETFIVDLPADRKAAAIKMKEENKLDEALSAIEVPENKKPTQNLSTLDLNEVAKKVEEPKVVVEEKPPQVVTKTQEKVKPMSEQKAAVPAEKTEKVTNVADSTVRVHVDLLDKLMNLAGELVLVRNQFLQLSGENENIELLNLSQNLDVVTSDLQGEVMKTRMQPIGSVLNKFNRVVRDLAKDLNKKIKLSLTGVETELDKTLLEAIKDPLTHIIRNSCDHGVETPEERVGKGKEEIGHVAIRAFHEGGQVVVEISDDGGGLDREKIGAKAIDKAIVTPEEVARMSDREVYALIFAPGFSTAAQVSSVSGRGVGMDVVKTNIEKIGGTVELDGELHKGTTIKLKIPLTLAIVPAMIVRVKDGTYAIPQVKLVELVRVELNQNDSDLRLERLQGQPVIRLRGQLLPVLDLNLILEDHELEDGVVDNIFDKETLNVVILNADGEMFGLIVDEILDTADIVVKPLSQFLKNLDIFSGATIMGDGSVSLILDVQGISEKEGIHHSSQDIEKAIFQDSSAKTTSAADSQEFLLFEVNAKNKYSIPLCLVNRLEEFSENLIEFMGEQPVVRYRGGILPLVSMNEFLGFGPSEIIKGANSVEEERTVAVVVTQKQGRLFGIMVSSILDVVTIDGVIDDSIKDRPGIWGSLVHNDQVIVVADVFEVMDRVIEKMLPSRAKDLEAEVKKANMAMSRTVNILYAEDTPFFRRQVTKILSKAGFEVETADNGQLALERLQNSEPHEFDLILSDIEMPKMTGYELAAELRKDKRFRTTPLIAVTTRFSDKDIKKGREVGFDTYLEKLNPDELVISIRDLIDKKGVA